MGHVDGLWVDASGVGSGGNGGGVNNIVWKIDEDYRGEAVYKEVTVDEGKNIRIGDSWSLERGVGS